MRVQVRVLGGEVAQQHLASIGPRVSGAALRNGMLAGSKLIVAGAKNNVQEQGLKKTGSLSRSITSEELVHGGAKIVIAIGTNLIYARIHEFGGTIHAQAAPYLVFKTEDGKWHSVKSVQIPARPYLRPAADVIGPEAARVAIEIVRLAVAA